MAGNSFGKLFKVTTWGESHGEALGVVIDGCPSQIEITEEDIQKELDRRRPGQSEITTTRKESDKVVILSGIFNGMTTGAPILLTVFNKDVDSSKYESSKDIFRPGHADYSLFKKFGIRDYRGGGRSSARETVARVAAGAVAKKILSMEGIKIYGYTKRVGDIEAEFIVYQEIENNSVRCPDKAASAKMEAKILEVKKEGNSIGGVIEIVVKGTPAGLGEPAFDKLDADLAKGVMSIPAVKAVEIGAGVEVASMTGDQNNDEYRIFDDKVSTFSNYSGGILGGISNGSDIVLRATVKPTPSISKKQRSVNEKGEEVELAIEGRHDPCICPRAVPVVESMVALVVLDHLLRQRSIEKWN